MQTSRALRAAALAGVLNLACVDAFSAAPTFLARTGSALPLRSVRAGVRAASPTCLLAVEQAATVAKETVNAAAKTVASPAAQAAKAKGAEAAAAASKAVTSNPDDSNVFSAILGTDSLAVTVLATIVALLAVTVTGGVIYLTFAQFQEEQYLKSLQDPNSAESRELAAERRALEMIEGGAAGKPKGKKKALQEMASLDSAPKRQEPNLMLEPGNRDERRARKQRQKREAKEAQKRGGSGQDDSLSSFSKDENKGFFDGLFK